MSTAHPSPPAQASLPLLDTPAPRPAPTPSYLRDHRKRLRARLMAGGLSAMPDYELLELILFRAIPRQDVKPLAHRLMERFGNFNAVISAPQDQLSDIPGVADAVIAELRIIQAAAHRLAQTRLSQRQVLSSWQALLDYCHITMAHHQTETFRVFFLDRKNNLLKDEELARGTVDHVPVYPREIIKRALQLNASALILVHNHPSGDPTPSDSDIAMTRAVQDAAQTMGIVLHDHLVIGQSHEVSFRSEGLLASL